MPITPTEKIWINGELVPWADANIHILTHSLHYGMGVFEGIRAYETDDGPGIFRLTDHMVRMHNSARIMGMELPYTVEELVDAAKLVVRVNGLPSCYVRPIACPGPMTLAIGEEYHRTVTGKVDRYKDWVEHVH